jgi:hypothetical protein
MRTKINNYILNIMIGICISLIIFILLLLISPFSLLIILLISVIDSITITKYLIIKINEINIKIYGDLYPRINNI